MMGEALFERHESVSYSRRSAVHAANGVKQYQICPCGSTIEDPVSATRFRPLVTISMYLCTI